MNSIIFPRWIYRVWVRNNDMRELILPAIPGFTVYYDDFAEQDPITGYDTVEWFSDAAYTQKVTGDVEAQGQTLYARRVANDYTIVFSANGGSGAPPSVGAKYDQTVSLPKQEPLRRGYTFQGWSADIYGDASVYAAGEEVCNLAGKTQGEKITLYAQWAANKYTVRFEKGADDAEGRAQAAYRAGQLIREQTDKLEAFTKVCEWLAKADEYASAAMRDVGSAMLGEYRFLLREYESMSTENRAYVSEEVTEGLRARMRICEAKESALTAINDRFAIYSEQDYSPAQWEKMLQVLAENIAAAESAESEEGIGQIVFEAMEQMEQIPTKEAESADPPDAGPVPPEEQNPVPPEDDLSPQVPEVPSEGGGAWKVAVIVAAIIVAAGALALIVYFIRRKGR